MKAFRCLFGLDIWADYDSGQEVGLEPLAVIEALITFLNRDDQQQLKHAMIAGRGGGSSRLGRKRIRRRITEKQVKRLALRHRKTRPTLILANIPAGSVVFAEETTTQFVTVLHSLIFIFRKSAGALSTTSCSR